VNVPMPVHPGNPVALEIYTAAMCVITVGLLVWWAVVPIGYAWFCGGLLYFTARFYAAGPTRARVWAVLAAVVVVDYVAIAVTTWVGVAGFYGDPPLNLGGYPLWWAAIDGVDVVAGGAVVSFSLHACAGGRDCG
jgi:hypothetical protein